jgi:uncharacterized membrane protein (DUF485 family)
MAPQEESPRGKDLTPVSGSETDVARLGRGPKPFHEKTAVEDDGHVDWNAMSRSPAYRELIGKKIRFILPACLFFIAYYFALPVLVGFFPEVMAQTVWGKVNLAYLFALSQFFMVWILAGFYVVAANRFDRKVEGILEDRKGGKGGRK